MELKEMILSTLAELDEGVKKEGLQPPVYHKEETYVHVVEETCEQEPLVLESIHEEISNDNQQQFYANLRERILVLFEGFQSPNNKNIEAKLDLTLNFLEYLLATIDEELERMDKAK
jgi:hypothetical protein